jgi:hypothetical protein
MTLLKPLICLLCFATSFACMVLLLRGWLRTRTTLLFWSGLCFVALTVNNLLLFIDLVVLPTEISLVPLRQLSALIAVSVLVYGFVWESE